MKTLSKKQLQKVLLENIKHWEKSYYIAAREKAIRNIKKEIESYGWDREIEQQVFDYLDKHYESIAQKAFMFYRNR